jgi:glycosyltransferase involved in cell wall biosynthesis
VITVSRNIRADARSRLLALGLRAQRAPLPIPRRLRSIAAAHLERSIAAASACAPAVDDWSTPLRARPGAGGDAPRAVPLPDHARTNGDWPLAPTLHCVVATSVLDAGGVENVVGELARHLPLSGIAVTVLHVREYDDEPGLPGRLARQLRDEGIEVLEQSRDAAIEWLARHHVDVISAHGRTFWLLECATALDIPFVETLHGGELLMDEWAVELDRSRDIRMLVAVSDAVRQHYLTRNPEFDPRCIVTVPNAAPAVHAYAVDRAQARRWLGLRDEFLFVSLARYSLQKNLYGLVEAFSEVAHARPDAHLLVAGRVDDAPYAEQTVALRERLSTADNVHLRDHSPHTVALLAAADGFVLDSFYEGWSLASMEALSAGLPVVMSDVSGAREQLGDDGERGIIVPNPLGRNAEVTWDAARQARFQTQANRAELVAALVAILDDRAIWSERRAALAAESMERFRADRWIARHAELLRQAAGPPDSEHPGVRAEIVTDQEDRPVDGQRPVASPTAPCESDAVGPATRIWA